MCNLYVGGVSMVAVTLLIFVAIFCGVLLRAQEQKHRNEIVGIRKELEQLYANIDEYVEVAKGRL